MLEALVGTLPAKVQPYAKTYTAALVTVLIVITASIDAPRWLTIALAVLTSPLVFAMPNLDPKGRKQDESVQPPDAPAVVVEAGNSVNVPADGVQRNYELRGLDKPAGPDYPVEGPGA